MQTREHDQPCPFCAQSEVRVTGERDKNRHREIRLECTPCGQLWWEPFQEPVSVADDAQTASPIDGWVQGMVRTMNELSRNPELRRQLSKRGF